jgi:hypothetical protein
MASRCGNSCIYTRDSTLWIRTRIWTFIHPSIEIRVRPSPSATWGCRLDIPKSYRTTPMFAWLFFDLFTRFVTISIASTPVLPLRMPPPRRISCFETHVDHPQKWDFWIQHRRSAEKEPNRAKQLYIRLAAAVRLQTDTPARRNRLPLVPVTLK